MTRAMRRMRKYLIVVACIALIAGVAIGGTVAWLADTTDEVKNTFSPSNISIELDEKDTDNSTADKDRDTANSYQFVPGVNLVKDPQVRVNADVDFYVFIVENKSEDWPETATYSIDGKWEKVNGTTNVYYQEIAADTLINEQWSDFILAGIGNGDYANGYINVPNTMTNGDMPTANVTLNFEAYAIQKTGFGSAAEAWTEAQKLKTTTTPMT